MARLIEGSDYFLHYAQFPNRANPSAVFPNDDGTYDIYLNTLYSMGELQIWLEHELRHLTKNHLYSNQPIRAIEIQADTDEDIFRQKDKIPLFSSEKALAAYVIRIAEQNNICL